MAALVAQADGRLTGLGTLPMTAHVLAVAEAVHGMERYDTVVFDPQLLRMLVELVGPGRVMLGSDYPFDMGDPDPCATLSAAGLPATAVVAIESDTARAFLGL